MKYLSRTINLEMKRVRYGNIYANSSRKYKGLGEGKLQLRAARLLTQLGEELDVDELEFDSAVLAGRRRKTLEPSSFDIVKIRFLTRLISSGYLRLSTDREVKERNKAVLTLSRMRLPIVLDHNYEIRAHVGIPRIKFGCGKQMVNIWPSKEAGTVTLIRGNVYIMRFSEPLIRKRQTMKLVSENMRRPEYTIRKHVPSVSLPVLRVVNKKVGQSKGILVVDVPLRLMRKDVRYMYINRRLLDSEGYNEIMVDERTQDQVMVSSTAYSVETFERINLEGNRKHTDGDGRTRKVFESLAVPSCVRRAKGVDVKKALLRSGRKVNFKTLARAVHLRVGDVIRIMNCNFFNKRLTGEGHSYLYRCKEGGGKKVCGLTISELEEYGIVTREESIGNLDQKSQEAHGIEREPVYRNDIGVEVRVVMAKKYRKNDKRRELRVNEKKDTYCNKDVDRLEWKVKRTEDVEVILLPATAHGQ